MIYLAFICMLYACYRMLVLLHVSQSFCKKPALVAMHFVVNGLIGPDVT